MNGSLVRLQLEPRSGLPAIVEEDIGVGSAGGELVAVEGMPLHIVEQAFLLGVVEKWRGRRRVVQFEYAHVAFAACCQTGSLRKAPRHAGHGGNPRCTGCTGYIGCIGCIGPIGPIGPIRTIRTIRNGRILECECVLGVCGVVKGGLLMLAQVVD